MKTMKSSVKFIYLLEKIKCLAEPVKYADNSLAPKSQLMLKEYIENSAKGCGCQFIIATHSPFLLALEDATIYNLDTMYGEQERWTELENTRTYYEFFKSYSDEFE